MKPARTFAVALLAGAATTLVALHAAPVMTNPLVPGIVERDGTGAQVERWHSAPVDRLAVTGAEGERFPDAIALLSEPRLARSTASTLKVRDAHGTVIAVASRFTAPERDGRVATWWTFVAGARGTLAAYVPDATTGMGRLLGGTREFENASGEFVEERDASGAFTLRIVRTAASSTP